MRYGLDADIMLSSAVSKGSSNCALGMLYTTPATNKITCLTHCGNNVTCTLYLYLLLPLQHPLGKRSLFTYSSLLKQLRRIVPSCESYMAFAMNDFNTEKETLKAMAIYVYYHCRRRNVFALYVRYALFSSYMYRAIVMWALTVDQCRQKWQLLLVIQL